MLATSAPGTGVVTITSKKPPQYIRQASSTCSSAVIEWVPRAVVSPDDRRPVGIADAEAHGAPQHHAHRGSKGPRPRMETWISLPVRRW